MQEKQDRIPKESDRRRLFEDRKLAAMTVLDAIKSKRYFFYLTLSLTLLGTFLGHYLQVPTYQTRATLFVQDTNAPSAAQYLLNQAQSGLSGADRVESYVSHMSSDSFFLRVAEKIKFKKEFSTLNMVAPRAKSKLSWRYWKNTFLQNDEDWIASDREKKLLMPVEKIAGFLRKTVSYHFEYGSQFIGITAKTLDPHTSQVVANLIAEEFVAITNTNNLDEVKQIENFVKNKKEETEIRVKEYDKRLVEFKQRNKIISTDVSSKSLADRISKIDTQIQDAELHEKEKKKLLKQLRTSRESTLKKIFSQGSKAQGFGTAETSHILQSRIDQLKKEKSIYIAQGLTENNWRMKKIDEQIDENVRRLKRVITDTSNSYSDLNPEEARNKILKLEDELKALKARVSTLKSAREKLQAQVDVLPTLQQEYIQLENKFKTEINTLSTLERKEKELEIQRISQKKEVRVDQVAGLPGPTPRGSLIMKLIFSSLAAFFLGLLIILGLESLDPTVKTRQDLFDCGLEFFGEVPFVVNPKKRKKRAGRLQFGSPEDLICKVRPESVESMSFKYMRARIESMRYKEKKTCQIITLSSGLHNEGKSFVAANLAISLAQLNRKVLLIDSDLRRPSQSAYFGLSNQLGLVDLLNMKQDLQDILETESHKNLHIIPAGLSGNDSTELISGQKFRLLLDHLREEYDYIVVDTPPTFAVVDAAIIASFSDIPILVASFRETRKADLYESYNDLLQVSYKNVYGIINKAIVSNSRIHYYGYPFEDKSLSETSAFVPGADDESAAEFLKKLKKKTS